MSNLQYGINFTESDAHKWLEENDRQQSGVRSWRQLFGNASLSHKAQTDALNVELSNAMSQAYESNMTQQNAILRSGLNTAGTNKLLSQNRQDLHTAYNTYIKNYASALSGIDNSYNEEITALNTALDERATNTVNVLNKAYDYLSSELYGATQTIPGSAENGAEAILNKKEITGYKDINLMYLKDKGLDWVLNTNGTLKSWDELKKEMINPDGTLNERGVEFFDVIYNVDTQNYTVTNDDGDTHGLRTFDEWLGDTDADLQAWYASPDAFNWSKAGTNRGLINIYTGRESDDYKFARHEYIKPSSLSHFGGKDKALSDDKLEDFQKQAKKTTTSVFWNSIREGFGLGTADDSEFGAVYDNFKNEINTSRKKLEDAFTQSVGNERANKFYQRADIKAINDDIDKMMADLRTYPDTKAKKKRKELMKTIANAYERLYEEMYKYLERNTYTTGKSSGY